MTGSEGEAKTYHEASRKLAKGIMQQLSFSELEETQG